MGLTADPGMLLFLLIAGHALADIPLQTTFIANGKNRNTEVGREVWFIVLPAHGLIHGGCVALVTGIWWLGLAETLCHCLIDFTKCERRIGMITDQTLHIACKLAWFAIALQAL